MGPAPFAYMWTANDASREAIWINGNQAKRPRLLVCDKWGTTLPSYRIGLEAKMV